MARARRRRRVQGNKAAVVAALGFHQSSAVEASELKRETLVCDGGMVGSGRGMDKEEGVTAIEAGRGGTRRGRKHQEKIRHGKKGARMRLAEVTDG